MKLEKGIEANENIFSRAFAFDLPCIMVQESLDGYEFAFPSVNQVSKQTSVLKKEKAKEKVRVTCALVA